MIICIELYSNYKSIWKVSIRTAGIEISKVFGCYTRGLPCHRQTHATLTSHSKWNEVTESYANSVLHFQTADLSPHQILPVSFQWDYVPAFPLTTDPLLNLGTWSLWGCRAGTPNPLCVLPLCLNGSVFSLWASFCFIMSERVVQKCQVCQSHLGSNSESVPQFALW